MNNSSTNLTLIKAKSYAGKGKMDEACQLYFRILERFPQNKSANDGLLRIHEILAIDYKKEPARYCGMNITDNPFYDH